MTYSEIGDLIELNLASGVKIPAVDHREVEMALLNYINDNLPKRYDTKDIFVDSTYLGNNFEVSGLGKNERLGWAICNGATHSGITTPVGGKVVVSYGGEFTTLNEVGGEKNHLLTESELPAHSHDVASYAGALTSSLRISSPTTTGIGGGKTSSVGGGVAHNNMPPYLVLVKIMKL